MSRSGSIVWSVVVPADPRVQDRVDRPGSVRLEGHRDGVRALGIERVGQRLDAVVAEPARRIDVEDPGQVPALVEQLGRIGQLADDEVDHRVGRDRRPVHDLAEVAGGDVRGEDLGVVAGTVDGPRVGRDAVPLEALGPLADRPREPDPGHRRALPPGRLDGQLALHRTSRRRGPAGPGAGVTKPGRRDDVVDVHGDVRAAVRAAQRRRAGRRPRRARPGPARHPGWRRRHPGRCPRTAGRSGRGRRPASGCPPTASRARATPAGAGAPTAAGRWRVRSPEFCLPTIRTHRPA